MKNAAGPSIKRLLNHPAKQASGIRRAGAVLLGAFLSFAGTSHLSFARSGSTAQVPSWVPVNADAVVLASGVLEFGLGASLVAWRKRRVPAGLAAAAFFVAVFPGNVSQYATGTSAFGLHTDGARLIRLFFQPVLVLFALWSTGAWCVWRARTSRP